jgi:hypothetical protein
VTGRFSLQNSWTCSNMWTCGPVSFLNQVRKCSQSTSRIVPNPNQ